jgi:hypothetical protein
MTFVRDSAGGVTHLNSRVRGYDGAETVLSAKKMK